MGGMAQWQKEWFKQKEREGEKVIVVDPKGDINWNYLIFGKAGEEKKIRS